VLSPTRSDRTPATRLALRSFVIGFALSAAMIAGAGNLAAATRIAHDSESPVDFAADHGDLQDKQGRAILTGNVVVTQGELRLTADRTLMAYTNNGKVTLQRVDATGHVVVTRPGERASGDVGVYDLNRKLITMVGHVVLTRSNGDVLNGGRLVIDLNTGLSTMDGHSSSPGGAGNVPGVSAAGAGRVSGTFNVPKKDDTGKKGDGARKNP
jgi:lipopolysaccharide export system protein LptA